MQYFKFLLTLTIFSAVLSNCTVKEERNRQAHIKQEISNEKIELNEGAKWHVNEEMKPFILNSEAILKAYKSSNDLSHVELAEELRAQNNQLIKSCTMKGESHDELHKWLHPHLQLVKALKNAETEKEAEVHIKELTDSYETYHQYFE